MTKGLKTFWDRVIKDEKGDLVQNIMWLAFIALACVLAIGALGGALGDAADNATEKLRESIAGGD